MEDEQALRIQVATLTAEVARLSACIKAFGVEDEHISSRSLPEESVAIHVHRQCDWDGAAVNDAGLDRLRGAAIRLAFTVAEGIERHGQA